MHSLAVLGRALWFTLGWCFAVFFIVAGLSGCASVEESDHWRDAVKADKGLIRGS